VGKFTGAFFSSFISLFNEIYRYGINQKVLMQVLNQKQLSKFSFQKSCVKVLQDFFIQVERLEGREELRVS